MVEYRIYKTANGHTLLYHGEPCETPILAMEDYTKWYDIFMISPGGIVCPVPFDQYHIVEKKVSHLWSDHIPYPLACEAIAEHLGAEWCERSLEVIYGRYLLEKRDGVL